MAQNPHLLTRPRSRRALPILLAGSLLVGAGCTDSPSVAPRSQASQAASVTSETENSILFLADYRQAFAAAQRENRMVLLFFTASWCHYCHEMEAEAFEDPAIRQLAQQFICVRVDADQEAKLCEQFQVSAFPTVQFVSPRGASLSRLIGKQPPEQLARQMQEILGAVARQRGSSSLIR